MPRLATNPSFFYFVFLNLIKSGRLFNLLPDVPGGDLYTTC